ncbi:hypothetical protein [Streptomyces sp. SKN60]|nr:hypothetical protein [Streptomyces sp. SKN60]
MHRTLTEAAGQAIAGDTEAFAAVVTDVLDRCGGPLRDGYAIR